MSKYKFSPRERYAVWQAYGGQCLYTRVPVGFADAEIDHIIPESIDDKEKAELLSRLGLPEDFNLNSYENWVLSAKSPNRQKGVNQLDENSLRYYLNMARVKAVKAREFEEKAIKQAKKDRAQIAVLIGESIQNKGDFSNFVNVVARASGRQGCWTYWCFKCPIERNCRVISR